MTSRRGPEEGGGEVVASPQAARDFAERIATAEWAARTAYRDSVGDPDRLGRALDAYRIALTSEGLLPVEPGRPSPWQVQEAARLLAAHSCNRRYSGDMGVVRLLESRANVEHAYAAACAAATARQEPREEIRVSLADARDLLLSVMASDSEAS